MLPDYPRPEGMTPDSPTASPLQVAVRSLAGKMRILGYLGMFGGALAAIASLFFNPLMIPLHVVVAVAGLQLIRSGNAFGDCATEDRTDNWLDAIRSLNGYFVFQFIAMGVAFVVFALLLWIHIKNL